MEEPEFFKKFLEAGGELSILDLTIKCCNKKDTANIRLDLALKEYVTNGWITINCSCGKELHFSLEELFSKTTNTPITKCSICSEQIPKKLWLKIKGKKIPYHKIHELFEHPEKTRNNKELRKFLKLISSS